MKQAGGKSAELTFSQKQEVLNSDYDIKNGNNPYYQWGRKDPMLPGDGIGDADKTCYPSSPEYKFKYGSEGLNTNDIKEYIKNPHKFNIKSEMDGRYLNLWSTDNARTDANDEVVIKSVYDPSPVGYSLPASNAFTGFTDTGLNTGNPGNPAIFNVKGSFDKGWYFYTKLNRKGNTIFLLTTGLRSDSYGLVKANSGVYWTIGISNLKYGRYLNFSENYIGPLHDLSKAYGFAVRSAEEKVLKCELEEVENRVCSIGESYKGSKELDIITMKGLCERSSIVSRTMSVIIYS